jgi:hypothetical protein
MTSSEPPTQGSRWAYPAAGSPAAPPSPPAAPPGGPRHAYAPASDAAPGSYYPPESAYPGPSSIYRPRLPADSGVRPPRKDNNVRNIVFGIAAVLLAGGAAIVVASMASNGGGPVRSTTDVAFIKAVHSGIPRTEKRSDADILKVGHVVCEVLDADPTVRSVAGALTSNPYQYTTYESGFYMGASIVAYCPKYRYLIPSHR